MWTKRTIAGLAVAGLAVAGATGVAVAATTDDSAMDDKLDSLVEDGTITQDDADAFGRVAEEFQTLREQKRAEMQAQREADRAELAEVAGVTVEEMEAALQDGTTLREIAGDNAAAVAALLTQRAEEKLAEMQAAIPDMVEKQMDAAHGERGFGMRGGKGFGMGMRGGMGDFGMGGMGGFGLGPGADSGESATTSNA